MQNLKITAVLDGTGAILDPFSPIHLDGLLGYAVLTERGPIESLAHDETPEEIELPLERREQNGSWHWAASVFEPEGDGESIQMARRRFDVSRAELLRGTVRYDVGATKDTWKPWPLTLASKATAWCVGDADRIESLLGKHIRRLGSERARGKGGIARWIIEPVYEDFSCARDGLAMRYLPDAKAVHVVRPRPPYWHPMGAVPCLRPGETI
jgi:hypothetical protein